MQVPAVPLVPLDASEPIAAACLVSNASQRYGVSLQILQNPPATHSARFVPSRGSHQPRQSLQRATSFRKVFAPQSGRTPRSPFSTMAFVTSVPVLTTRRRAAASTKRYASPVAIAKKPEPPKDFSPPSPRPFYVRPDRAIDIAQASASQLLRTYAGAFVEGYRLKSEDGKLVEYSATLPKSKPDIPLRLFEFEACPFCRKVREAVSILDLDVLVFPCPKGGVLYRQFVKQIGGKTQFPYLQDPNTEFSGYESDDIIKYLYKTYGPSNARIPFVLSNAGTFSAGLAATLRRGRGRARSPKTVPAAEPLELWGYEASPFVRLVRETLADLELPYYLHTTARGSVKRAELKELVGRFQVPYLVDPNTDIAMFESAEICEYLRATYGADAAGAVKEPEAGTAFMPGDPWYKEPADEQTAEPQVKAAPVPEQSLNPQVETDEVLEQYCEQNPDSDECRVYED
ncbi:unnamed protein product [Agarophyton chilense]|eukprot:gb/GEZJ01000574.1/.p1 GENE.gb/GEZJ01000574.1/~~gb/GEZJ01000574.1/.p1  ORF type:complete len:458 (+),score=59.17 gb/GEZJ01000574.1/:151-1524(+)